MPTYEYQCEDCGKLFEIFQSISEPKKEKCEECGGHLTKLLSAGSGLIFKGSGFYITDYKKSTGGSDGANSSPESKSEGKATETPKSDNKPAESSPTPSTPAKTDT